MQSKPILNKQTQDIRDNPGDTVSYFIPQDTFTDPLGGPVSYSLTLTDGSALPVGLMFDPATGILSGTAPVVPAGIGLVLTATDLGGATAQEGFRILDGAPVLAQQTADQRLGINTPFSFVIPPATFSASANDLISYAVTQQDGTPLPSWMTFDPASMTVSGTTPPGAAGQAVTVTATSLSGVSAAETFHVYATPSAPLLATQQQDVRTHLGADAAFSFSLPAQSFSDPVGGTLALTATQPDGTALPAWLVFDPATGTFSGNMPAFGITQAITVTATSSEGASSAETFNIINTAAAPVDTTPDLVLHKNMSPPFHFPGQMTTWSWSFGGLFTDPNGGTVSYSFSNPDGTPLSGITSDAVAQTLSGALSSTVLETPILVTATTSEGASATGSVFLEFGNGTPVQTAQQNDQVIGLGSRFSFPLAQGLFNGAAFSNPVTYTALQASGSALPSWLTFDQASGTFSGTAPSAAVNQQVEIVANYNGFQAAQTFMVEVSAPRPVLTDPETDQVFTATGGAFSFVLPSDSFTAPTGGQPVISVTGPGGGNLPSWLSFDPVTSTFTGTAPEIGDFQSVTVTATNSNGSTSESFNVGNPGPPPTDEFPAYVFNTGLGAFSAPPNFWMDDPLGGTVTTVSTRLDGSALPSWLSTVQGQLSGTPPGGNYTLDVLLTSTTSHGGVAENTLSLVIGNGGGVTEGDPVLQTQAPDQRVTTGQAISFSLPANSFTDPNSGTVSYTVSQTSGAALPSWLSFDPATGGFSGTAPSSASTLGVRVTATSSEGVRGEEAFSVITGVPAPVLQTQQGDIRVSFGSMISAQISPGSFTDPQGGTVSYAATQADGTALPSWLSFDGTTDTLSGTAPDASGSQGVVVTATTSEGGSSAEAFKIITSAPPPVLQTQQNDVKAYGGADIALALPSNSFTDPAGGSVALAATQTDGTALPGWLSFDPASDSFGGTAPITQQTLGLMVTATSSEGGTSAEAFRFVVKPPADATATYGQNTSQTSFDVSPFDPFTYSLPLDAFTDTVGSTAFSYTATSSDGSALPAWLNLSPSGTFSGTGPASSQSGLSFDVTAIGNHGSVGHEIFSVSNNT